MTTFTRLLSLFAWLVAFQVAVPEQALAATSRLAGTSEERRVLASLRQQKFIRAREQAERILRHDPRSIIALFVLSQVFHREEGNLPRALFNLRQAESALDRYAGDHPRDDRVRRWQRRILLAQESILGEMDRRHEQLALLNRYEQQFGPDREFRRIWPLMKLHRFKEAQDLARKATLASDLETRISGYNGLLSIEFERERPVACFKVAMEAVRATGEQSCILDLNTSEAAFAVFDFEEVERLALKSIQAPIKDCPATAHTHLANLYLLRADFRRAISVVKEAREQPVAPRLRQQFEMGLTAWLTRLLLALGQFKLSHELAHRVLQTPDRVGLISYSSELMEVIYLVDYYAALDARIEDLYERGSARTVTDRLRSWAEAEALQTVLWTTRRKIERLLGPNQTLLSLLRPYIKPLPSWNAPLLATIAGEGASRVALGELRARPELKRESAPYYDAIDGELYYHANKLARALRMGLTAHKNLPRDEVLLRARVAAWTADAAYRLGKKDIAKHYFHQVLHLWPTALRVEHIPLPATIQAAEDGLSQAIAKRLLSSRRLRRDKLGLGFVVRVEMADKLPRICLSGARGRRYSCAQQKTAANADRQQQISDAIDAFHQQVFAPMIDLTQQDINSLDGSAVRGRADEVLREVFGIGT